MESNFMMPIGGKSILRSTGEEVEIIDSQFGERGARTDEDWVTYIDSNGKEHIKEHLNIQLDFKSATNNIFEQFTKLPSFNKLPTTSNCRIFEVAKELVKDGKDVDFAVSVAKELVDKVGIETE